MPINYETLIRRPFADVEQAYGPREAIIYALGVGYGADPTDPHQLRFVYEKELQPAPTFPLVLGSPGFWLDAADTGIDWVRAVHGEQGITIHKPLESEGRVVGRTRIVGIVDKGKGKGALLLTERQLYARKTGDLLATLSSSTFCRGDGGFGGSEDKSPEPHTVPDGAPEAACDLATMPQAALLYRLCGDANPLHADPAVAKAAGFRQPILHGLCTLGIAAHAILRTFGGYDPDALRSIRARFSAPVYPGEKIRTEMWSDGGIVSFRARVTDRDAIVLSNGRAELQRRH